MALSGSFASSIVSASDMSLQEEQHGCVFSATQEAAAGGSLEPSV